MQTMYSRICQTDPQEYGDKKIIDLAQYRRRLECREVPEVQPRPRSSQRQKRWGLFWEAVASLGVVVMAVTFCAELLL